MNKAEASLATTVLVTGSTGFLGEHAVEELGRRRVGCRTWGLEAGGDLQGDLRDPSLCREAVRGVSTVLHCAGVINARSRQEFREVNTEGSRRLAEEAVRAGVQRFVFVSSSDVVFHPEGAYGNSKAEAERALESVLGTRLRVVRPTVIYGPRDRKNVWAMLTLVRRSPRVCLLPGPGSGLRQPIWVGDLARALADGCLSADGGAPLRHLCGPDSVGVRTMLETIAAVQGVQRRFVSLPLAGPLGWLGKAGWPPLLVEHAEQLLSFEQDKAFGEEEGQWTPEEGPRIGFEEGMRRWVAVE